WVIDHGKMRTKHGDGRTEPVRDAPPRRPVHEFAGLCSPVELLNHGQGVKAMGRRKLGEREVLGVRVWVEAQGEKEFFFDKRTGWLVKSKAPSPKIVKGTAPFIEGSFDDHREIQGVVIPMRFEIRQAGKVIGGATIKEVRFEEKIDPSVFVLP